MRKDLLNITLTVNLPIKKIPNRPFDAGSLNFMCAGIEHRLNELVGEHHIKQTAAFQAATQMLREFVKNALDANAGIFEIELKYRPNEAAASQVIFTDNGAGFKDYSYEAYHLYDYETALLNQSPKKGLAQVYGGANLGLAIVDHYLSTFGNGGLLVKNDPRLHGAHIVLFSNAEECSKKISLCNSSPEPFYLNEMIASLQKSILDKMEQDYGRKFSISFEEFKEIRTQVFNDYAYENTDTLESLPGTKLMAQIIRAILLKKASPVSRAHLFNPFRQFEAMPDRARPKPLNPFHFGLLSGNKKAYVEELKSVGVDDIKNGDELDKRCEPFKTGDHAFEYHHLPLKADQEFQEWIKINVFRGPI